MASRRAPNPDASCPVTRGEVDLGAYAARDRNWVALGLGAPARRALVDAGLFALADLAGVTRAQVASLHGVGPKTFRTLAPHLAEAGITFKASREKR